MSNLAAQNRSVAARALRNPNIWFCLAFTALFAVGWVSSGSYPERVRFFPAFMTIVGLIACLTHLAIEIWRPRVYAEGDHLDVQADDRLSLGAAVRAAAPHFGGYLALLGAIVILGPIIPILVYVIVYSRLIAKIRWRWVLVSALVIALLLFGVFDYALGGGWMPGLVPWPQDWLLTAVRQLW